MMVLDLFSGIGGFTLGLTRAGHETIAFCEIEPFCQAVLKKHWPYVPCHNDIKTLDGSKYNGKIEIVCGGFPCQDISLAGKSAGLQGSRSGLFYEAIRIVKEADPDIILLENVAALRSRGLEEVVREISTIGYDVQWHCIPASAIGAHHQRDRIWILAYKSNATDSMCARLERQWEIASRISQELDNTCNTRWWDFEPNVDRVANGLSMRVDRIKSLGNSIVPQIAEAIGRVLV